MGKIFSAIDQQIIRPRVEQSASQGFSMTQTDIQSFYSQGAPQRYVRTHAYERSPVAPSISGGDGNYNYTIRLQTPGYVSRVFSPQEIMENIQYNGIGILGKPGTWQQAQEDIKQAVESAFSG